MSLDLELLSDATRASFLARIAHTLTICARDTYEIGTENVIDTRTLRAYNELLHHVTGSVVSHLSASEGYSLESVIDMIHSFGINHGRSQEMDWALSFAFKKAVQESRE